MKLEKAEQDGIQAVKGAENKLQKLTEENSQAIVKIKFDAGRDQKVKFSLSSPYASFKKN